MQGHLRSSQKRLFGHSLHVSKCKKICGGAPGLWLREGRPRQGETLRESRWQGHLGSPHRHHISCVLAILLPCCVPSFLAKASTGSVMVHGGVVIERDTRARRRKRRRTLGARPAEVRAPLFWCSVCRLVFRILALHHQLHFDKVRQLWMCIELNNTKWKLGVKAEFTKSL